MSHERSELVLLGVDFATAPLAVRESLSYPPDAAVPLLQRSADLPGLREAVVVSTCNRTEFYLAVDPGRTGDAAEGWLRRLRSERPGARALDPSCTLLQLEGEAAARHLFRVACGLESSILGDVHIGGQLRQAVALAGAAGTLGPFLGRLFQHAFSAMKSARTGTSIGRGHASLGSAVANLIAGRVPQHPRIALLGAGVAARDIGRQLAKWRVGRTVVINRTPEKAADLARQIGGDAAGSDDLARELADADVLVAATSAPAPLIRKADLTRAMAARPSRPLLVVDVCVPRNVEPSDAVTCVTIDDIASARDEALARRQAAVPAVEAMVDDELARWTRWLWRQPGEALLKQMFVEEPQRRAALVDRLVEAGSPTARADLDRLIASAWKPMLHQHARGLRRWLGEDTRV